MTDNRIAALILYTDASSEYPPHRYPVTPNVESYHRIVDGYIESLRLVLPDGTLLVMYVNEEGKLRGLPYNPLATAVARALDPHFGDDQIIVGNAIVAGVDGCDDIDVPTDAVTIVHQLHAELRIAGYVQTLREQGGDQR